MNELRLHPLTCPQCGAPGVVREGTRITECARCGARLCLSRTATPKYEAVANLHAAQALTTARAWIQARDQTGIFDRPQLILVPFHEIAGRRVGIFEQKIPERHRVHRTVRGSDGQTDVESKWVYTQKEDTKVMVSDVQHTAAAARPRWSLEMFDKAEARRRATLRAFDLVEAQRRATVYAEERTAADLTEQRYADRGVAEMVALSRRTIFFPFWEIPVQTVAGLYEIVVDGIGGNVVAWRMPQPYPSRSLTWTALVVPGALALGQGLRAAFSGGGGFDPAIVLVLGAIATTYGLIRANKPDWSIASWPEPEVQNAATNHES